MLKVDRHFMEQLFYRLVKTPGLAGTESENLTTDVVVNTFQQLNYFRENPQNLRILPVRNDGLGRRAVAALVKGKIESDRTVLLISHTDVVDVEDYGKNMELAFDPQNLMKAMKVDALSPEAKNDFLSGEWVFARGVMDMSCGIAVAMALIEAASNQADQLTGNLLFLAVPDEENDSLGMISAVEDLVTLAEEENLDYIACINGEPQFPKYPGDNNKYFYRGTLGKFLIMAFCVGKETHGGDSLSGLNANLIVSELTRKLELNMDLADIYEGVVTPPPTSLKQTDSKEHYNVKTPHSAYAYYNFLTVNKSPALFFDQVASLAREAMTEALDKHQYEVKRYCRLSGAKEFSFNWKANVFSYSELLKIAERDSGKEFTDHIAHCREEWLCSPKIDQRLLALQIVREVHSFCHDQDPKIILFYVPTYYPHIRPRTDNVKELFVYDVLEKTVDYAESEFAERVFIEDYFPGLCDLSYVCLQNAEDVIDNIGPNMPNWGLSYQLPVEAMKKLNLPAINIGPFGKDAHKNTERLHLDYSFRVYPALLAYAVNELLKGYPEK